MNSEADIEEVDLLTIGMFVLWVACAAVGAAGLLLRYSWPRPPVRQPPPVVAQIMHVTLTQQPLLPPDAGPPTPQSAVSPPAPPAPPQQIATPPPAPPLIAVATPSPQIAFAVPTRPKPGPQRLSSDQPVHLTFGQGAGRQPAPEYPREAALARQQGIVTVRFTVGEDGCVQTTRVIKSSHFPLLDQAAVRAVRETWRFPAGPMRSYQVSITFHLVLRQY